MGWKDAPLVEDSPKKSAWQDAPLVESEAPQASQGPLAWGDVGRQALGNFPASFAKKAGDTVEAFRHPIKTADSVVNLAAGGLRKAMPDALVNLNDSLNQSLGLPVNQPQLDQNSAMASAFGQYMKDRYGGVDQLKQTMASDPAGFLSDVSTLVSGAGGLTRMPQLSKAGAMLDPMTAAMTGAAKVAPKIGSGVANIIGGLGTHTGGESIKQAAKAGFQGGRVGQVFQDSLRGNLPMSEVVKEGKSALKGMRKQASNDYQVDMAGINMNPQVIGFQPIRQAVADAFKVGSYKGKVIDESANLIKAKILKKVEDWGRSDPAQYHTAGGLDKLKQAIGDIRDNTQQNTRSRVIADQVYNAIKDEIAKKNPDYKDAMKRYGDKVSLANEAKKTFSLGETASADTTLRKLQSLTRNNVNSNYGNRTELMNTLDQYTPFPIMPALAGQALTANLPRGLGGVMAGLNAGYGVANPAYLSLLPFQSPRLMGEAAYYAGKGGKAVSQAAGPFIDSLNALGIDPKLIPNILYQAQQADQRKEK